jgi:hypothetical protein
MSKFFISAVFCTLLAGCGSDVDKVKGGTLDFNKTITVGQALDNWRSCESKEWRSFSSDNGVKVVEFTCRHKVGDFFAKLKNATTSEDGKERIYIDVVNNTQTFQFTLNRDDTFQINAVEVQTTWADGSKFKDAQKPVESLEVAYKNELQFDPATLDDQVAAAGMAYLLAMTKPGEKYRISSANTAPTATNATTTDTPVQAPTGPLTENNPAQTAKAIKSTGKTATCEIKSNGAEPFKGECKFFPEAGGSFAVSLADASKPIIDEVTSVSVYVMEPGVAEVRGLTVDGINSRWGVAKRSTKDRACWTGDDFEVCAR